MTNEFKRPTKEEVVSDLNKVGFDSYITSMGEMSSDYWRSREDLLSLIQIIMEYVRDSEDDEYWEW